VKKQEKTILRDIQGFIQFVLDGKAPCRGNAYFWCISNITHDLGGLMREEDCFSPRTSGYSKHIK